MDQYTFDEKLQAKLLSLFRSGHLSQSDIHPDYFENPVLSSVCKSLQSMNGTAKSVTPDLLTHHVKKDLGTSAAREFLEDIKKFSKYICRDLPDNQVEALKKLAIEFAEFILYKKTIYESFDILRNIEVGSVEQLKQIWTKVVNTRTSVDQDLGKFYFSTVGERLKKRFEYPDVLQFFIPELDHSLDDGGFARGELNLFVGKTGTGKSFALIHAAKSAVFQKKKVVYYSLEMSLDKLSARLDASIANLLTRELRDNGEKVAQKVSKMERQYGDLLIIKNFPAGLAKISHLRQHIEELQRNNFQPDVIIIDYINLLSPERHTDSRYADLGQVYIDLRGLSQQFNLFLFTAAQSNRGSFNSELITAADLSETFIGSMSADTIVTLNQTDDEAKKQKMRLYIAKDRNSMDKVIISINTNFAHGAFYKRDPESRKEKIYGSEKKRQEAKVGKRR